MAQRNAPFLLCDSLRMLSPSALSRFAEGPQDAFAFRALAAQLVGLSSDAAAPAWAWAAELLESWPDESRMAPWSWCHALAERPTSNWAFWRATPVDPKWALVRHLETGKERFGKRAPNWERVFAAHELGGLTSFDVQSGSDDVALRAFLAVADRLQRARSVRVRDDYKPFLASNAHLALWSRLEALHVGSLHDDTFHAPPTSFVPRLRTGENLRTVTLRADDLMALWDRTPLPNLREARVFVLDAKQGEALAKRPELEGLVSLSLAFRCGNDGRSSMAPTLGNVIAEDDEAAARFFAQARLSRLRELSLVGRRMGYWSREGNGPATVAALVRSACMARLERLTLEHLPVGDEGLAPLLDALPTSLRALAVVDCFAHDETAERLARSAATAQLEDLDLSANRIRAGGWSRLADVPFTRLESLDVSGPASHPYYMHVGEQPVRDAGIDALMRGTVAASLRRFAARAARLTGASARLIAERATQLESLDLGHNQLDAESLRGMARAPVWQSLRELALTDCLLDDAAVVALAEIEEAPRLRVLRLAYNAIGATGAEALARWPVLGGLHHVDLHDNVLGDAGVIALARSPHVARLVELDLEQDCWNARTVVLSEEAGLALATSEGLARLDTVYAGCVDEYHGGAYSRGFTEAALAALRASTTLRPEVRASLAERAFEVHDVILDWAGLTEEERARRLAHDFRNHPRSTEDDPDEPADDRGPSFKRV